MANKVAGGADIFKYSGELQIRLKNDMQQLECCIAGEKKIIFREFSSLETDSELIINFPKSIILALGTNIGEHWIWTGVPFIQLIINKIKITNIFQQNSSIFNL